MSTNTTPEGAHQPFDDEGIHADGIVQHGVETTGEISTQPEFLSTHTSSVCEKVYVDTSNDKGHCSMYCQLVSSTTMNLFSLEQEPSWSTLSKNELRPPSKNSDLVKEVRHRATASNMRSAPRPSNWTQNQMIEWLEEHPVSDSSDVQFLTFEVLRLQDISLRMQQEQQHFISMDGVSRGGNWRGCVPYLRVIMTLTQDDVKSLFLSRGNCLSRTQLDARNSESRPQTCYELIAELWNSSDFNPMAPPSSCHSDFVSGIDCSHAVIAGLTAATAVRIADLFTSMRCKLLTIIKNWEASGQGDGGMDHEQDEGDDEQDLLGKNGSMGDEQEQREDAIDQDKNNESSSLAPTFGSLRQKPARALNSRAAFLAKRNAFIHPLLLGSGRESTVVVIMPATTQQPSKCS